MMDERDHEVQMVLAILDSILYGVYPECEDPMTEIRTEFHARLRKRSRSDLEKLIAGIIDQLVYMRQLPLTCSRDPALLQEMEEDITADELRQDLLWEIEEQEKRLAKLRRYATG